MTTKTEEQIEQEAKELAVKTISKFHDGLVDNNSSISQLKEIIEKKVNEPEEVKEIEDKSVTDLQIFQIESLMAEKNFDDERKEKAFVYFKIEKLEDLTEAQADMFLMQLEKA